MEYPEIHGEISRRINIHARKFVLRAIQSAVHLNKKFAHRPTWEVYFLIMLSICEINESPSYSEVLISVILSFSYTCNNNVKIYSLQLDASQFFFDLILRDGLSQFLFSDFSKKMCIRF